jgi:hypothetical protein
MEKAIFAPKTKSDKRANRKIYSNIESTVEKQFSDGPSSSSRITELFYECILIECILTGRLLASKPFVYLPPEIEF